MIAKCITKKMNLQINKIYLVFGGRYSENLDGKKIITEILTQVDSESLFYINASFFSISNLDFSHYNLMEEGIFVYENIAYEDFISNYYEERVEEYDKYKKAQEDFLTAKMCLYDELSDEIIEERLNNEHQNEQDFIFEYLRIRKNSKYISFAIEKINRAINSNGKWYEVDTAFKYLSTFKNEIVSDFFIKYMLDDYWGNQDINKIVYDYF